MSITVEPRPYQVEPLRVFLERQNILLALDTGLGKSLISLMAAEHLLETAQVDRVLLVVPAGLKYQWAEAIARFTDLPGQKKRFKGETITIPDSRYCMVIDGTVAKRKKQYALARDEPRCNYVIVGYDNVTSDERDVKRLRAEMIVLDEASAIKTLAAARTKAIKEKLEAPWRMALTATPIDNRPDELFCADETTEILTEHGWLAYNEVRAGDKALTLNHSTGMSEWDQVQAVNIFPVVDQKMLLMEHRDHSSLTTMNHRWPVERVQYSGGSRSGWRRDWAISESFRFGDRVPIAASRADLPTVPVHSDELVELVAWIYTEGHVRKLRDGSSGSAVNITQNTGTEGERRIADALHSMFGPSVDGFPRTGQYTDGTPRWRVKHDGSATVFVLNTSAGGVLLEQAPEKIPSLPFLLSLTASQLDLFIETSMLADNNGKHWFSQKNSAAAEAFAYALVLAGRPVSVAKEPKVSIDRNGNPYNMTRVTLRRQRYFSPGQSPRLGSVVSYTGNVWCPTTANGTWLARRNGKVYFTGNSIMEWVDPEVLGRGDLFDLAYIERNRFGDPVGYKNLDVLRKRIGNAMYRKSVSDPDVAPFMPRRDFLDWRVNMDAATREVYVKMAWDLLTALEEAQARGESFSVIAHYAGRKPDESTPVGKVMSIHMAMEMLLDHPDLLVDSALDYAETAGERGSKYANSIYGSGLLDELTHSCKLRVLMDKMRVIMDDPGSKVIVFTRYRRMQQLIMEDFEYKGWNPASYHGMLTTAEQQAARARFLKNPDCRVFVSTHAGERGTDLPVANWLVNVEPVWSSGQADQINGRHMRTSSEFEDIFVANMVVAGTIEERKLDQQDGKRKVARAIVDGYMPKSGRIKSTTESLTKHLRAWLTEHDADGMVLHEAAE